MRSYQYEVLTYDSVWMYKCFGVWSARMVRGYDYDL